VNGVRYQRRLRGWNQEELAQRAGLRQRTVSSTETGRSNPHPKTLLRLAQALGVEIADLMEAPTTPEAAPSQDEAEPTRPERVEVPQALAQLLRERAGVHMPLTRLSPSALEELFTAVEDAEGKAWLHERLKDEQAVIRGFAAEVKTRLEAGARITPPARERLRVWLEGSERAVLIGRELTLHPFATRAEVPA
jgi:transcriptional regulator with XRE-family HTH domain